MNDRQLRDALHNLEIGMKMVVPHAWGDREISSDDLDRDTKMGSIALEHDCNWTNRDGEYTFTKIAPTGLGRPWPLQSV